MLQVQMTASTQTDELKRRYLEAQLAGDRRAALRLVADAAQSGRHSLVELRDGVIRDAQRQIGVLWERNAITIAQEHMATAISHLALADLYRRESPAPANGYRIVVACVEGELHEFPARLVADALDVAGFDVRFLGASVPTDALIEFIVREQPDFVLLSATMAFHAGSVRDAVARIHQATGGTVPIGVGGQVCSWVERVSQDLHVDILCADADSLVDDITRILQSRQ